MNTHVRIEIREDDRIMIKTEMVKIKDIIVSKEFLDTVPSEKKYQKYKDYYSNFGKCKRMILLDEDNILVDGYKQYLILKENNIEEIQVKKNVSARYKNNSTTYIFGRHINSKDERIYTWRVPNSWTNWADNVQVGDSILCQTKFGIAPVIVTKVEVLDKCPVDFRVKKVASKEIRRGEYTVIP